MIRRRVPLRRSSAARGPCLEGCGARAQTRGLCGQHYGQAVRAVAKSATTWEQLEREGRCLPPAPSKVHNRRVVRDGITFQSVLEADYFAWLQDKQVAGVIRDLQPHPRYELLPTQHYKADATYVEVATGLRITVDTKGAATKGGRFPSVCVSWRYMMDHPLVVVERGRGGGFVETKRILPQPLPPGWRGHRTTEARAGAVAC